MKKRTDRLKNGDWVVMTENVIAMVAGVMQFNGEGERGKTHLALMNPVTNRTSEMRVPNSLEWEIVEGN